MDKAEQRQIAEIERMKAAIEKTDSPRLRNDYTKGIKRLEKELAEYRYWRYGEATQGNRP